MYRIPESAPISDISRQQGVVLSRLQEGPLMIMQRTTPVAVMITPQQWNRVAERMEMLELFFQAAEADAKAEREPDSVTTLDNLCERLGVDPYEMAGRERPSTSN